MKKSFLKGILTICRSSRLLSKRGSLDFTVKFGSFVGVAESRSRCYRGLARAFRQSLEIEYLWDVLLRQRVAKEL